MKELKKLKLKDIVKTPLDVSEMYKLVAGIDDGIMLAAYGCYGFVCISDQIRSEMECTTKKCYSVACVSSA